MLMDIKQSRENVPISHSHVPFPALRDLEGLREIHREQQIGIWMGVYRMKRRVVDFGDDQRNASAPNRAARWIYYIG